MKASTLARHVVAGMATRAARVTGSGGQRSSPRVRAVVTVALLALSGCSLDSSPRFELRHQPTTIGNPDCQLPCCRRDFVFGQAGEPFPDECYLDGGVESRP